MSTSNAFDPDTCGFRVRRAEWSCDAPALQFIRHAVFVREQQVPEALEWDGQDVHGCHVIAESAHGEPIGCGRLLTGEDHQTRAALPSRTARIGRMAVLLPWRGRGVGRALLRALIAQAANAGCERACLHAQTHALGFYEREGFAAQGPVFDDAGIPHRAMQRQLLRVQPGGAPSSEKA